MITFEKNGYYYCSNCNSELETLYNYCPWCGTHKDQKTLKDYMRKPYKPELEKNIINTIKGITSMTGTEYQKLAMRTNDEMNTVRLIDKIDGTLDIGGILDGCLGLSGETGELIDIIKKWIFHGKPLDIEHAKKELGDVCWYIAMIAHSFGWNLDEILQMNIDKLKARYPEGFSTELANHRKESDI